MVNETTDANALHGMDQRQVRGKARLALARRDLLEFIRDRRTLFVTLLLPMAMYPILALSSALGVRTALSDIDSRNAGTDLAVVLTGSPWDAHALATCVERLIDEATDGGPPRRGWPAKITFAFATEDEARDAVEAGHATLWIEVPENVLERLEGDDTIRLPVHGPSTRALPLRERGQFVAAMEGLADAARRRRIERAGLPEAVLEPLRLDFTGTADAPGSISGREILPTAAGGVFVLLAVLTLTGAFYPAIDAIAGEKERGTIETLLIAPCAAIDVVAGKFLAVWAVALAGLVANVISLGLTAVVTLRFLPQSGPLLPSGHLPVVVVVSIVSFIGLSAVAAAMSLAVTTASKSQKEAQNTLTPVLLFASALAGAGLLSDLRGKPWLAAVPFGGQVAVARATLEADAPPQASAAADVPLGAIGRLVVPTAVSLVSSTVLVWLLLQGTALLLTDEEILFRGPDVAGGVLSRPARRRRPTVAQGLAALLIGLAGLWYAQGLSPADFPRAILVQQAAAVGLPLLVLLAWQRVDLRRSFAIRWPGAGGGTAWRAALSTLGGGLLGAGLFVVGAALLLALRGTDVSDEARTLAGKLVTMMRTHPLWLSWTLMALVPAVGEELLFRGWVQSALVGAWPTRGRAALGLVVQAACFAIFHLLPERMPQTFVLGLVAGALTLASGSLLPAVVCHAAHNSMPLVLLWLGGGLSGPSPVDLPATGANLPGWAVAAAVAAVAVGAGLVWAVVAGAAGHGPHRTAGARALSLAGLIAALGGSIMAGPPAAEGVAADGASAAPAPQVVRVAVMPIASAVEWTGVRPTGVTVEIWDEASRRLGIASRFFRVNTFKELMESLPSGSADVALGPIAITAERERLFDLTHPIAHSGLRVAVRHREATGFLPALRSLVSWELLQLLGGVLALAVVSGHLLWWFERRWNPESFPPGYVRGVWEALWWIASTVVAGGCDNKHVASVLGRAIAFAWMIGGIVLLAAFTSVLTATITAEHVVGAIHGPKDLSGRTVGCQESSVSAMAVRQRGGIPREFAMLDEAIVALDTGSIDAIVAENQQLMALANRPSGPPLKLVGAMFESFDFGLGLPSGSPLREPLNTAILAMREDGTIDRILERWLGRHD